MTAMALCIPESYRSSLHDSQLLSFYLSLFPIAWQVPLGGDKRAVSIVDVGGSSTASGATLLVS